jgi:flagella basal body P-ring formation protein FlgA
MTLSALFLALTLAAGGDDGAPRRVPIVVALKTDALVRGTEVLIGDVASIDAPSLEVAERVARISFGRRPGLGFHRVLSDRDVLARLLQDGLLAADVKVAGAREVVVQAACTVLQPQELLDVAEPVLRAAIDLEQQDVEYELAVPLKPQRVPPGRRAFEVKPALRGGQLQRASAIVELGFWVDGELWETLPVQFRLRRYGQVLITTGAVRRGTPLDASNVEDRRVESAQISSAFLNRIEAVAGKVAARDLRSGERLTLAALADPAVVCRGDQVALVSSRGSIRIATKGIAQADGAVGARIAVMNVTSGKLVQAVVEGPGVVSVAGLH